MTTADIRVAVAVAPDGSWGAFGAHNVSADDSFSCASEDLPCGEARYWLTATLPLPKTNVRQAVIADAVTDWDKIDWSYNPPSVPGYYAAKDDNGRRIIVAVYNKNGRLMALGFGNLSSLFFGPRVAPLPEEGA